VAAEPKSPIAQIKETTRPCAPTTYFDIISILNLLSTMSGIRFPSEITIGRHGIPKFVSRCLNPSSDKEDVSGTQCVHQVDIHFTTRRRLLLREGIYRKNLPGLRLSTVAYIHRKHNVS
jgi:hypothetical protein